MALQITDACINCGYCEKECPHQAIYEPGMTWTFDDGTSFSGFISLKNGRVVHAEEIQDPRSNKTYFIVSEKCNECRGDYQEPQCLLVCPNPESLTIYQQDRAQLERS